MNSKLNRNYTDWTYIGYLAGNFDFAESSRQFQDMFSSGNYYAKFDKNNDTWFFTQESSGTFRFPHYTVKYTGNGSETTSEHFTYARGKHIYASSLPKNDAEARFNKELNDIIADYPEVNNYFV